MVTEQEFKELVDVAKAGVAYGNAFGKSLEDKKFTVSDSVHFLDPIMKTPAAIENFSMVPLPSRLSPEQMEELCTIIADEFDIPQDKVEGLIEDGIKLLFKNIDYGKRVYEAVKK